MRLSDFDFDLPADLIAQAPLPQRSDSRLLRLAQGGLSDHRFADLPMILRADDLLVVNDTRVIKARLLGRKLGSGGNVEALVERVTGEYEVLAQTRASKALRAGGQLRFDGVASASADSALATIQGREGEFTRLRFREPVSDVLARCGRMPLPPYISRAANAADDERYQTVFARAEGSVAAPTAGLHFDQAILDALSARGLIIARVTLHVGAGTFKPVREEVLSRHQMHTERYVIDAENAQLINQARAAGRRVVAVGTTSLRTLESAANERGEIEAGVGETKLFITPGYRFKLVDALITNFHLPRSTLLMLVSACCGQQLIRAAYAHAIAQRYRFFSYGDAMLIEPHSQTDRQSELQTERQPRASTAPDA